MYYFKKLNENYFIYFILIFVFIPLNYIPQLFDGVFIDYTLETGNLNAIDFWYKDASRYVHFFIIYFIPWLGGLAHSLIIVFPCARTSL